MDGKDKKRCPMKRGASLFLGLFQKQKAVRNDNTAPLFMRSLPPRSTFFTKIAITTHSRLTASFSLCID